MTGGGLLQLVAYGAQDVYLTGNPQVTFFKQLYRRHTNFAMQAVEAQFNGSPGFDRRLSLVVPRVGDLMGRTYLEATFPAVELAEPEDIFKWTPELGHFLIRNIEVQIGGQTIDKHYGYWLSIWNQLTIDAGKATGYQSMVSHPEDTAQNSTPAGTVIVPLQFWFCRHEGLALPLIALQYHEVRIVVELESFSNLTDKRASTLGLTSSSFSGGLPVLQDVKLWIDYIFLDTDERRKFAQVSHEYLIDQLQFTGDETLSTNSNTKIKLNFNHPVKELIWIVMSNERQNSEYALPGADKILESNGEESGVNPVKLAHLQFNGHDRFSERRGTYFADVQTYQHHKNIPHTPGINVYSFALYPELEQPSGTANFSRIDNATLQMSLTNKAQQEKDLPSYSTHIDDADLAHICKIYAVSYNVLRIMSGMGGVAYSN